MSVALLSVESAHPYILWRCTTIVCDHCERCSVWVSPNTMRAREAAMESMAAKGSCTRCALHCSAVSRPSLTPDQINSALLGMRTALEHPGRARRALRYPLLRRLCGAQCGVQREARRDNIDMEVNHKLLQTCILRLDTFYGEINHTTLWRTRWDSTLPRTARGGAHSRRPCTAITQPRCTSQRGESARTISSELHRRCTLQNHVPRRAGDVARAAEV